MKYTIWTSDPNYEDWKEDLEEEYPDSDGYTEDDRIRLMYEKNGEYFSDEVANLNKELGNEIIVLAHLGLWYGNRTGHKFLKGTNLNDCLSGTCGDYTEWYVENGELQCEDKHHDGTNHYIYRVLRDGYDQDDFEEYSWDHSMKEAVERMTEPLGHYVAEIYGFEEKAV